MSANKRVLYRNTEKGKIAGVCAGISDYFHSEVWLVRVVLVSIFLLGGAGLIIISYIALMLILDPKPKAKHEDYSDLHLKRKPWQNGASTKQAMQEINSKFGQLEKRLRHLEGYVTSSRYDLKDQINRL